MFAISKIKEAYFFKALRSGMIRTFPIVLIGSFACVLANLPIDGYMQFLADFDRGALLEFLNIINKCCVGSIAIWMLLFVSHSYAMAVNSKNPIFYPTTTLCCYLMLVYNKKLNSDPLEFFCNKWTFTAILVTLISCFLLRKFIERFSQGEIHIYSTGADNSFLETLRMLAPVACVVCIFAIIRVAMVLSFGGVDFYNFGGWLGTSIFDKIHNGYLAGVLFVFLVHLFWFFGVHGNNMLEPIASSFQSHIGTGTICTKTFVDVFVLMGGCGVSICIILAILLARSNQRNRHLAKLSLMPGLFNVNETVIYGLPVFFEPILFIPFILSPIAVFSISYFFTVLGVIPVVNTEVVWQMPVIFSGYIATKSVMGSIMQVVNICIGTAIYLPFIKRLEQKQEREFKSNITQVVDCIKKAELNGVRAGLLHQTGVVGDTAKSLAEDLKNTIINEQDQLQIYYQPKVTYDDRFFGAEALLRWKHPLGVMYPPLVIELADEMGFSDRLGLLIIEKTCKMIEDFSAHTSAPVNISVNITADQLKNRKFAEEVEAIVKKYDFHGSKLVFELTERISLSNDPVVSTQLEALCKLGIILSLDDFGMGHSSLLYLQEHSFKSVKIDGSVIRNLMDNESSRNIVTSMVAFVENTDIVLIAEYVETEEQKEMLHNLGCDHYQGYLYSKALPYEDMVIYYDSLNK